jgi:hypothetical protein
MFGGYTFAMGSATPIAKAFAGWGWLELREGCRSWFGHRSHAAPDHTRAAAVPVEVQPGLTGPAAAEIPHR